MDTFRCFAVLLPLFHATVTQLEAAERPTAKSAAAQVGAKPAQVNTAWPFDAKEAAKRQEEAAKALGKPKSVSLNLGNRVTLRFVLIPAGKFMMGSPASENGRQGSAGPQHEVTITRPFYMGLTKVTQAQYESIIGKNPSRHLGKTNPVDSVDWEEAAEFCKKVSQKTGKQIHLSSEAQWEWACRAGTATRYSFGDDEV